MVIESNPAANSVHALPWNLMVLDLQSVNTQLRCVPTEVGRAPQSKRCAKGRSWMVLLYTGLLTGRFQFESWWRNSKSAFSDHRAASVLMVLPPKT